MGSILYITELIIYMDIWFGLSGHDACFLYILLISSQNMWYLHDYQKLTYHKVHIMELLLWFLSACANQRYKSRNCCPNNVFLIGLDYRYGKLVWLRLTWWLVYFGFEANICVLSVWLYYCCAWFMWTWWLVGLVMQFDSLLGLLTTWLVGWAWYWHGCIVGLGSGTCNWMVE